MSTDEHPAPAPSTPVFSTANFIAKMESHAGLAATLHEPNKAVLFDVLEAAGVTRVTVHFDGVGDSGQIEDMQAYAGDDPVALPTNKIAIRSAIWGSFEPESHILPVPDAIERLAYDFLSETHGGWENNDGAWGEFTFDTAARTITLDYNERYSTSEYYSHEF